MLHKLRHVRLAICLHTLRNIGFTHGLVPFNDNDVVEVMLLSQLDESRGYCLDIAGGQGTNAELDKGLQAHTCYHYTGSILEDQGFNAALIDDG